MGRLGWSIKHGGGGKVFKPRDVSEQWNGDPEWGGWVWRAVVPASLGTRMMEVLLFPLKAAKAAWAWTSPAGREEKNLEAPSRETFMDQTLQCIFLGPETSHMVPLTPREARKYRL